MEQIELYDMLKLFIQENKENEKRNADEHREIFRVLKEVESRLSSIEMAQKNFIDAKLECNKTLNDHETRIRAIENMKRLQDLPDRVDRLARQVYGVGGAMAVIMILVSWFLRSHGG